jgi:inhibitor of KinA sporulation pathway (predicted exonuclease)
MKLGYDLVVFDLESNGPTGPIIEIGATILTRRNTVLGRFQTFVQCDQPILKEITELTTIKDSDMIGAPTLKDAVENFFAWAQKEAGTKNLVLASWSNWDTATLRSQCEAQGIEYPFRGKTLDIKSIAVWMSCLLDRNTGSEGLQHMLESWDLKFIGHPHSALCDAENTAILLKQIWEYYEIHSDNLLESMRALGLAK